ncbi:lactonase family protein [Variovorax sp. J22G21]|uniref:lactonase family protein n=1 Tax=Variovorax fucosicus TaxID=3053517 RepID=UPI002578C39E|nr:MULTISPECIES: lactonase family protein [unclassified Variovorax]MDM0040045.1 lactonase family protein [Variovorax sp. J22R193]MDM0061418.1 lactonase family protein [Variovorax sp. J22G21]
MPSRRQLLQASALASGLGALGLTTSISQAATSGPVYAYVGTYTDGGKPWRGGRGLGVHQFVVDSTTGALKPIPGAPPAVASTGDNAKLRNPASLARHPALPMLYAANEFEAGSVSAFRIGANGALSFVAEMACGGKDPAHISVHPDGRFLFTANYASGDVSVLALRTDGSFDADRAAVVYKDVTACGATPCKPGADVVPAAARSHEGFATSDHDGPHAHMVHSDPGGNFVLVADLGLDRVISYRFDRTTGVLSQPSTVAVSESAGARHFCFHPNGKWLYLVNEEASTIAFMRYDGNAGVLTLVSETSALPAGFKGTSYASGIRMLPDGQHFVSLNRLHDSISLFRIDPRSGAPTLVREEWSRGNYPRSCTLDPSGKFLYVCHNKQGDNVTIFRVQKGDIRFTGQYVAVGSASAIEFSA